MNNAVNRNKNNNVVLVGEVAGALSYSHEVFGEGFYVFDMNIQRASGITDTVPVMISERIYNIKSIKAGNFYEVMGQFRSYNKYDERGSHLVLSVFALGMLELDEEEFSAENNVMIEGYVCKKVVYRQTPLGREIADLLIAVNRAFGKSDYIPCIIWGRNARYASSLEVGRHVRLKGRIQSREFVKKICEEKTEKRVAFELSASQIVLCE